MNFYIPATTGGKHQGSQADLEHDVRKRQQRMGNLAEGVTRTPITFTTPSTHAILPDTGFAPGDDFSGEVSPLEVPILIKQRRSWPMYRRQHTQIWLTK